MKYVIVMAIALSAAGCAHKTRVPVAKKVDPRVFDVSPDYMKAIDPRYNPALTYGG